MDIKQVNNDIKELKEKINSLTNLLSYLDFYKVIKSVSITATQESSIPDTEKLETAFLGLPVNSAFSVNTDVGDSFEGRGHKLHTGSVVLKFFGNKEEVISPPKSGVGSPAVSKTNNSLIEGSYTPSSTEDSEPIEISLASAQFREESIIPTKGTITAPTPNVHFFDEYGEEVFFSPLISFENNRYKFGNIPRYVSYCKYVS